LFFFHSCFAANVDDEISVVHCCQRPSSMPDGAALNTEAMAATHAIASKRQPEPFLFLLLFLHFSFPPSESAMRGLPETKGMKLFVGCGSDGRHG